MRRRATRVNRTPLDAGNARTPARRAPVDGGDKLHAARVVNAADPRAVRRPAS